MMGQTKRPNLVSHGSRVEERHDGEASAERGDVEPARCKTAGFGFPWPCRCHLMGHSGQTAAPPKGRRRSGLGSPVSFQGFQKGTAADAKEVELAQVGPCLVFLTWLLPLAPSVSFVCLFVFVKKYILRGK